jgi:katanin p80 WD40 repeat-containing subunit B1
VSEIRAAAKAEPKQEIIPAQRNAPVNLPVDSFLPGANQAQLADGEVLRQVLEPYHSMCGILTNRLTVVKAVHTLWRKGDFRESVLLMCKMKDPAVAVDLLSRAQIKTAKDFTLDMAVEFLPLMQELMASRFEDYIVVALEMSGVLLKGFSSLIKMTRATIGQGRDQVDISKEERLDKCNKCFSIFMSMEGSVRTIAQHDGRVGTTAQELLRGFDSAKLW